MDLSEHDDLLKQYELLAGKYELITTFLIFRYKALTHYEEGNYEIDVASILTEILTNWNVKKRYAFSLGDIEMYDQSFNTQTFELIIEIDDNARSYDYKKGLPQDLIEELEQTRQADFVHDFENNDIGLRFQTGGIEVCGRIPNMVEFLVWFRDRFHEEYNDLLIMSYEEIYPPECDFFLARKTAEEMQHAMINKIKEVPELMDSNYEEED